MFPSAHVDIIYYTNNSTLAYYPSLIQALHFQPKQLLLCTVFGCSYIVRSMCKFTGQKGETLLRIMMVFTLHLLHQSEREYYELGWVELASY